MCQALQQEEKDATYNTHGLRNVPGTVVGQGRDPIHTHPECMKTSPGSTAPTPAKLRVSRRTPDSTGL